MTQKIYDDFGNIPQPAINKTVKILEQIEKKYKRCSKCKTIKPATEYNKKSAAKDGLQNYCRSCQHGYGAEYRPIVNARRVEIDGHFIVTELPCGAHYYQLRPEYIK